jgi:hypothetical protein
VALATCAPPEKTYSASRTSNLTYGLLLVTLLLCSVPATISFLQSHQECGPHMFSSMQDRINYYIGRAPSEGLRYSICFRPPREDLKLLKFLQFPVKGSEALFWKFARVAEK